jgi:hypothetical protein
MSIPGSANLLLAGGGAAYQIDQSLRFNSADSAYLNRTPGSSGSTTTWTISTWVKRASLGAAQMIWSAGTSGITTLSFQSDDTLRLRNSTVEYITNWRFRDPSAWYHIVVKWDTTNGTQADRAIIYVNGVALGTGDYSTYDKATSSEASTWNTNVAHNLGRYAFNGTSYLGGYLAEINFIDGSALTPSSFGETDLITGAWIPKKYSGSYGTNGFYLTFADNSNTTAATLGKDYSGNGNNWTPNSFSVTAGTGNDVLSDTPTTNWATILSTNPTYGYETTTFTDGNLQTTFYPRGDIGNPSAPALSSITIPASGKWYYEFTTAGSNNYTFGIAANNSGNLYNFTLSRAFWGWYHLYQAGYPSNGNGNSIYGGASGSASGGGFINVGDIIGVEIDIPNGSIVFKKNGSSYASITSCNFSSYTEFVIQWGTATNGISGSSIIANFGQRSFSYTQPTGYKALNTANLPEPTIKNSEVFQYGALDWKRKHPDNLRRWI